MPSYVLCMFTFYSTVLLPFPFLLFFYVGHPLKIVLCFLFSECVSIYYPTICDALFLSK
jgi:hypothetical protein